MAGHICILVCFAIVAVQWTSAQQPWNMFSGIGAGNPWQQQQQQGQSLRTNNDYQYVTCSITTQTQDSVQVTFTRPQPQVQNQPWWMPPQQTQRQWWEPPEPVHMSAVVRSGTGSMFAGNMQMVMTDYGPINQNCNQQQMGSITEGFQNRNNIQNNLWSNMQNQNQNQNQFQKPAGMIGSAFNLQSAHQVLMSELVYIDFNTMVGRGLGFCQTMGNACTGYMLPLCCTLGRHNQAVSGMLQNGQNRMNGQMGNSAFPNTQNTGFLGGNTGAGLPTAGNTSPLLG